jgi:hypothetical protein
VKHECDCSREEQVLDFDEETATCPKCGKVYDMRDDDEAGIGFMSAICLAAFTVFVIVLMMIWVQP